MILYYDIESTQQIPALYQCDIQATKHYCKKSHDHVNWYFYLFIFLHQLNLLVVSYGPVSILCVLVNILSHSHSRFFKPSQFI